MPYRDSGDGKPDWGLRILLAVLMFLIGCIGWGMGDHTHLLETGHHSSWGCCARGKK